MKLAADFLRYTQFPGCVCFACSLGHGVCNSLNIDDGMAGKDLWQAVSQVTSQAFAGTLIQAQLEFQGIPMSSCITERDVVAPSSASPNRASKNHLNALPEKPTQAFLP